jgi:type 1 glutamine amidotransferase
MTQRPWTRREALRRLAAGLAGAALLGGAARAEEKPKKPRKLLLFTKSSGFEHSVIKRQDGSLGHAERILSDLGKKHGFEVTATKDGRVFDEDLGPYDAFFFYTSGDLTKPGTDKQPPMSEKGKQALLDAVAGGKGFAGSHCASDSFHTPGSRFENQEKKDPYIAMLGGEFIRHGPQQKARMRVVSPRFPGLEGAGEGFVLHEEWYSLKNFAPDLHVILVNETEGMQGKDYQRPPFPATWARRHGKGRVFYTSMGHREDVWENAIFQEILLGGLAWVFGDAEAEVTPNLLEVTPEASRMPPQ